jgi:hypothetical protein
MVATFHHFNKPSVRFERFVDCSGFIKTGVGSGVIHFQTGPAGNPTAFQFSSHDQFEAVPIAIARIQGFSA